MPIDNYQAKRTATLKNREADLMKLLLSECHDDKKLFEAGDLIKQAHIRLLRAKLEQAELQRPSKFAIIINNKSGIHKRENITKQIEKLKTKIEYWKNLPVEKIIDRYKENYR